MAVRAPRRRRSTCARAAGTTRSWTTGTTWCPGILVQLVTMVGTLLTAMNIVREKELGTLDQLNVTPITRGAVHRGEADPALDRSRCSISRSD